MPKPTDMEVFRPRQDGLFERKGIWREATVGCLILGSSGRRGDIWEIVAAANGTGQLPWAHTPWFQMRSHETQDVVSQPPIYKSRVATFLTTSPDDRNPLPPVMPAVDADRVALLIETLGAAEILTMDNATGEAYAPFYANGDHALADWHYAREEMMHLRICHQIDTEVAEKLPHDERLVAITNAHARAHSPTEPHFGKGGITHRHMPDGDRMFQ